MIIAAILAVMIEDLISSVIALSTVGLGLSLAFLILKAPNLAITQLVVEIICVIILIRATINKDIPLVKDGRWFFNTVATLGFVGSFLIFVFFALRELPNFGQPLMRISSEYISSGFKFTGCTNLVSAITLSFRSYDALIESAILFSALVAVLVITRKIGKIHEK